MWPGDKPCWAWCAFLWPVPPMGSGGLGLLVLTVTIPQGKLGQIGHAGWVEPQTRSWAWVKQVMRPARTHCRFSSPLAHEKSEGPSILLMFGESRSTRCYSGGNSQQQSLRNWWGWSCQQLGRTKLPCRTSHVRWLQTAGCFWGACAVPWSACGYLHIASESQPLCGRIYGYGLVSWHCNDFIQQEVRLLEAELQVSLKAAGGQSFGSYFRGPWCTASWPPAWREVGVTSNFGIPWTVSHCGGSSYLGRRIRQCICSFLMYKIWWVLFGPMINDASE